MLPPNISAEAWEQALAAFRRTVGDEWVFTSDEDTGLYRDAYSPVWDEPEERLISAAVAPKSAEEVQAIVRTAHEHGIPVFPISTGKNLGYGGSAPNLSGSVIIDMKRMNKVIEVDDKRHFAIVEPGVSYFDLYRHIQDNNLNVWIDVPDPGWGSVMGNALDHGVGHTWYSYRDHFNAHCGLEVVLPDGEMMRTGMGAMPGAPTFADFRYGFGPYVDGLFAQAGFGIVIKMGIHLMPPPEAFLHRRVLVSRREDLIPLIEITNRLEDAGLIGMPLYESPMFYAQFADPELRAIGKSADVWNGNAINRYSAEKGVAPWQLGLSFYGPTEVVEASWRHARSLYEKAIPGVRFEDVETLSFPLTAQQTEAVKHKVLIGMPNMNVFSMGARSQANPEPADGHLLFSPMVPRTGEEVFKAQRIFTEGMTAMGVDFPYAYGPFTAPFTWIPRVFALTTGLPVSRSDTAMNKLSRDTMSRLITLGAEHGYGEYRTPPLFQDQVMGTYNFNDNILRRFCETLKDAVDPKGIIAPGRGGFWPAIMRKAGK
ncbi:FAD-binding oxidoreductase [Paracoccus yeei]|uniref:FAD-binding oxidoreductase n=1 Tax=Paracoccus yeei TaxID=147645 RepID=UPI00242B94D2|nr:FAD-binding oxidoreductase [Paracoccus yeei]